MPTLKQMLCAAVAAGCFFSPAPAGARFGKSGGSGSSGSRPSGGSGARASGGASASGSHASGRFTEWRVREHRSSGEQQRVHDATPVGQESNGGSTPDNGGGRPDRGPRRTIIVPTPAWIPPHGIYASHYRQSGPYPVETEEPDEPSHPVMVRMGVEGNRLKDGKTMSFNLGIEERRWGVATRLTALTLHADDGSDETDHIQLVEAHVTLAPLVGEHGRLRLEAGVAAARAPDVTFVGPSMAVSFERCLIGAMDLEGRLQWVPMPHLQLDGQAGLAVHMGVMTVRAGWRGLLLDDRGLVDGVVHRDTLGGPFAGVGLNF
ncbi:hypothetical protein [Vitiosangium sp. GDMCC 1.1324]|uniref:hypothetical protein n=1 Tax=Vitiosangium sp. (strain GDMCC 1.1324) TaxID=2138576 RepID=UPI000D3685B1|nr:hypothetical protein [Vitiosangium sp. GDMCC 1.1324]PTL75806.1 hypothetical protein DAT35_53150 [Vitiosangium sp. GDMCC 1.1324]